MKNHYRKFMIIGVIAIMVAVGGLFLHQPSEQSEAAVVYSNIASADSTCSAGTQQASVFDVPVGPDYQVNNVQLRLTENVTTNPRIYADNAGAIGLEVIDLGAQAIAGTNTYTFTPIGANVLTNGGRYWLVLPAAAGWCSSNPVTDPTGVFTFVSNGIFFPNYTPSAGRRKLAIDADPIVAPPPGGGGSACTNTDSRINPICEEPWQTAAVYCRADGSIDVYGITNGEGWLAFRTTQAEIDAVGVPNQNALIEASDDGKIRLYRLSTGEFQVNAPMWDDIRGNLPDGYVFMWDGCQ